MKIYKEDVYPYNRNYNLSARRRTAWKSGYNFIELDNGEVHTIYDGHGGDLLCKSLGLFMEELPSRGSSDFRDRVIEFALAPKRSDPNAIFEALTKAGFFKVQDEAAQKSIILSILDRPSEYGFCYEGVKKFREHMGVLLPQPKPRVVTIEMELPSSGRSLYGYNKESVAKDIQNHFINVGSMGTDKNLYLNCKVRAIKDTSEEI